MGDMFREKASYNYVCNDGCYSIAREDFDVWKPRNPGGSYDEWEKQINIYDYYTFTRTACKKLRLKPQSKMVRIVSLGSDYLEYLKQQGIEDTDDARVQYMTGTSDEKAAKMLIEMPYNRPTTLCGLPTTIVLNENRIASDRIDTCISENVRTTLRTLFESIFGKGNVYVARCIMDALRLYDEAERLGEIASGYFDTGADVKLIKWEELEAPANIERMYIPICIWTDRRSAYFPSGEDFSACTPQVYYDFPEFAVYEKTFMEQYHIPGRSFEELGEAPNDLLEKGEAIPYDWEPFLYTPKEAIQDSSKFYKSMIKMARTKAATKKE